MSEKRDDGEKKGKSETHKNKVKIKSYKSSKQEGSWS